MTDPGQDTERLSVIEEQRLLISNQYAEITRLCRELDGHEHTIIELVKRLAEHTQERDEARRSAEALEEDLRQTAEAVRQEKAEVERLSAQPTPDDVERARKLLLTWMRTRPAGVYQSSIQATEAKRLFAIIAAALTAARREGTHPKSQDINYSDEALEAAFVAHGVRADGAVSLDDIDRPLRGYIIATAYAIERARREDVDRWKPIDELPPNQVAFLGRWQRDTVGRPVWQYAKGMLREDRSIYWLYIPVGVKPPTHFHPQLDAPK